MEYISSDTNIWFDFHSISRTALPFQLPYTYLIYKETLRREVISPPELLDNLRKLGLEETEITADEFFYAQDLAPRYVKLSGYDRIALAIAKFRSIPLLTGDSALRKAAEDEGVRVFGTIGLLDRLYRGNYIDKPEYAICLKAFLESSQRRLPADELQKRLNSL